MNFKHTCLILVCIFIMTEVSMASPSKCLPQTHECSYKSKNFAIIIQYTYNIIIKFYFR